MIAIGGAADLSGGIALAALAQFDPLQTSGRRTACVMGPIQPGRVAHARTRPERRRGRQPERGQGGVPGGVGAALLIDDHFADFGAWSGRKGNGGIPPSKGNSTVPTIEMHCSLGTATMRPSVLRQLPDPS